MNPEPIIRNLQNGLLATASSDLGKSAVSDQVSLLPEVDNVEPIAQHDKAYQGLIEINHDDKAVDDFDQKDNDLEPDELQKPEGRQVNNHYIEEPKPTLKELENLYPNESPLLAPN